MRTVCAPTDACDNALHAADIAFANAVTACDHYGYESENCTSALGVANRAADVAAEKCHPSELSTNTMKNILIFPLRNVGKKQDGLLS